MLTINVSLPPWAASAVLLLGGALWTRVPVCAYDYQVVTGAQINNSYYGQEKNYYCGPATAQMILGSPPVNLAPLPSQDSLYATIQAKNNNNGRYYTNPSGLQGALANYDPPANGRIYVAYAISNFDSATRTLAYNIDHYQVTGGALIYQGGHWINVYGVDTSVKPALSGANANFTVNGFYVRDPWEGFAPGEGLGGEPSAYLANSAGGLWQEDFTPSKWGGTWGNKYAFVTDPEDDTISTSTTTTFTGATITSGTAAANAATTDITANNPGDDPTLSSDRSFEGGAFSTIGSSEITRSNGVTDWIVPYYQTGNITTPDAIALISSASGALDGAFWDEGVLSGDSLATFVTDFQSTENGTAAWLTDNVPVPDPATLAIMGLAGGVLLLIRRRRGPLSRRNI